MKTIRYISVLSIAAAMLTLFSNAWGWDLFQNHTTEGIHSYYQVPMTDGTLLGTDVYLPEEGEGPWPVI